MLVSAIFRNCNTAGATSGAETAYLSATLEFIPSFSGYRVTLTLDLCVMFLKSLFVLFRLVIVSVLLRFTDFYYPFSIFNFVVFMGVLFVCFVFRFIDPSSLNY